MPYPLGEVLLAAPLMLAAALLVGWAAVRLGFPVTPPDERLGFVDGLRGVLALAVLTHHFSFWMNVALVNGRWAAPNDFFFNCGKGGVACFFMITGLVFFRYVEAGADRVDWRKLYVSRAFRILPLTFVVVGVAAAASLLLAGASRQLAPARTLRALAYWVSGYGEPPLFGYAHSARLNAGVLWSLGFEWLFYLAVLPGLAVIAWMARGRASALVGPVGLILLALAWTLHRPEALKPVYLLLFGMGMLIARARRVAWIARALSGPVAAAAILAALGSAMAFSDHAFAAGPLAAYALLLLAVAGGNSLFGLLKTAPMRALGDASFGVYMLHGFILSALVPALAAYTSPHPLWWGPLCAIGATAAALASYVVIERPMIDLGKRVAHWAPRRDRSLAVEVAP